MARVWFSGTLADCNGWGRFRKGPWHRTVRPPLRRRLERQRNKHCFRQKIDGLEIGGDLKVRTWRKH